MAEKNYLTGRQARNIAKENRRSAAHEEHHHLVQFIESRDLERFEALTRKHIERSKQNCLAALEEQMSQRRV